MKKIITVALVVLIIILIAVVIINLYVKAFTDERILSRDEASDISGADMIIVLGCGVKADGRPSDMLYDRISAGASLFGKSDIPVILMSGDSENEGYDEVTPMKEYAEKAGVPEDRILTDGLGLSTFESIYRAKTEFGAKKIIIVTHKYHLTRALYIARELGMDAYGADADLREYSGQSMRYLREKIATVKDFFKAIVY